MYNYSPLFMSNQQPNMDQELLFMDIFRKHEGRLYALALKLTKSASQAQDIIQEVFLKLWEQREDIRQIRNMEAWLYRLTENKVIDFLRKAAADDRLRETIWNSLPQNSHSTETMVAGNEYEHILQKAIALLPPQRKLIYCLNREAGMNYQEIASELHISRHTVKNQLSSALQSIRSFVIRTTGPLCILFFNFF